ncbi:dihydrodipicolinate synthase family protein [Microbacterium sp.]|uniref:dihydrodipicolinate synthase family protein n=1 Tax=Microbacterium sp. TaxID=51671 RepID=UPI002734FC7A|nr:dihydrodipicolinate synthase family protein [Microbacterium sp.]MDP3950065.1 dihydrodipicolinate synthase family protein [Microbacterium sp.]
MYTIVRDAAQTFADTLIAAAATPMTTDRRTDTEVTKSYFESLVSTGADGLAVAVHTGRPPVLDMPTRAELVSVACSMTPIVVTGVSSAEGGPDEREWPILAARAGASALLVFASAGESVGTALGRYDELWNSTGLPLIAFDLYSNPYSLDELSELLDHPAVAAFKPARLYDAVACQDAIALARERGRCVLSGEDRMLGPSLMWGAQGALVGLAAATVRPTAALISAHRDGDARAFLRASSAVDALAVSTFRQPWDGYVQRMLWIAADEGLIPSEYAVDPLRPAGLHDAEHDEVIAAARRAHEILSSGDA